MVKSCSNLSQNQKKWLVCTSIAVVVLLFLITMATTFEVLFGSSPKYTESVLYTEYRDFLPINGISGCEDCDYIFGDYNIPSYCSMDHSWVNGSITLELPWSNVGDIRILMGVPLKAFFSIDSQSMNEDEESQNERRVIEGSVCTKDGECTKCGSFVSEVLSADVIGQRVRQDTIHCDSGWGYLGNRILLTQSNNKDVYTQPCEIRAVGQVAVYDSVEEIEVYAAVGESKPPENPTDLNREFVAPNAIDGQFKTQPEDCFVSNKKTEGWAKFDLPWSFVTHIKLLNSHGKDSNNIEGIFVSVCRFPDETCLPCGVTRTVSAGEWTSLYCDGGWLEGNQLKLEHSYERLQFCEINVFGIEKRDPSFRGDSWPFRLIPQLAYNYSYDMTSYSYEYVDWGSQNMQRRLNKRGQISSDDNTCFRTMNGSNYFAFRTDLLTLLYLQIITCVENSCGNPEGLRVCAWSDANSTAYQCKNAGVMKPGERYTALFPEEPVVNTFIIHSINGTDVQVCRAEVFGTNFVLSSFRA